MLHPDVIVKKSKIAGRGLFAKRKISRGTILWRLKDFRAYDKKDLKKFSKKYADMIKKFAYEDWDGKLIYCIDKAKFWNHSCNPNSAPLNEETDIAVMNIQKGEELTYDYAVLLKDFEAPVRCKCGEKNCRHIVKRLKRNSKIVKALYARAKRAARSLKKVKQPLLKN